MTSVQHVYNINTSKTTWKHCHHHVCRSRGCSVWQQCQVGRACIGSRRAESRKQAAPLSQCVLCYVGQSFILWVLQLLLISSFCGWTYVRNGLSSKVLCFIFTISSLYKPQLSITNMTIFKNTHTCQSTIWDLNIMVYFILWAMNTD